MKPCAYLTLRPVVNALLLYPGIPALRSRLSDGIPVCHCQLTQLWGGACVACRSFAALVNWPFGQSREKVQKLFGDLELESWEASGI